MSTNTDTTFMVETDRDDDKAKAAAAKAAAKAAKALAKAEAKAAADKAKADSDAAKAAAATDAKAAALEAIATYNLAYHAAGTAAEAATGGELGEAMQAIARALTSGVKAKALEGVVIGDKAVKADTVAKYGIAGRALMLGGEMPALAGKGSVAHRVRAAIESATDRGVGRKALGEAISASASTAQAVATIDTLEGKPSDGKAPHILALLKAAGGTIGKAAWLADEEGVLADEADDILALCDEYLATIAAIRTAAEEVLASL